MAEAITFTFVISSCPVLVESSDIGVVTGPMQRNNKENFRNANAVVLCGAVADLLLKTQTSIIRC